MGRAEKKIREALADIGYTPKTVRWEPVGRVLETGGREGGWFVDDDPIGLND